MKNTLILARAKQHLVCQLIKSIKIDIISWQQNIVFHSCQIHININFLWKVKYRFYFLNDSTCDSLSECNMWQLLPRSRFCFSVYDHFKTISMFIDIVWFLIWNICLHYRILQEMYHYQNSIYYHLYNDSVVTTTDPKWKRIILISWTRTGNTG